MLAFTLLAAIVATLLFGFVPALQLTSTELIHAIKSGTTARTVRQLHVRDVVVGVQIAVSVVLVISFVLMVRTLQHALGLHLGFDPRHAVSMSFDVGLQGYGQQRGRVIQQRVRCIIRVTRRNGHRNNKQHATQNRGDSEWRLGRCRRHQNCRWRSSTTYPLSMFPCGGNASPDRAGHRSADRSTSPRVAVVNQTLARAAFADQDPVGKRFRIGHAPATDAIEIVGIVEDGKYQSLGETPTLAAFVPLAQDYNPWTTLVARTSLPPADALRAIRHAIAEIDPSLALFNIGTLKDQLAFALLPAQVAAIVLGAFGMIAVTLAATGVFALMAYAVSRRTREIGLRIALGARRAQVASVVLRRTITI